MGFGRKRHLVFSVPGSLAERACAWAQMRERARTLTHTHRHTCAHAHTHTHTHTHTRTRTHTHAHAGLPSLKRIHTNQTTTIQSHFTPRAESMVNLLPVPDGTIRCQANSTGVANIHGPHNDKPLLQVSRGDRVKCVYPATPVQSAPPSYLANCSELSSACVCVVWALRC